MSVSEYAVVGTDRGEVRGVEEGEVVAFRGVPYAASPVGALRFAPPQAHPGWAAVRDAARSGPSVPQAPSRLELVQGPRVADWQEDGSLTVNVFAPRRALVDGVARPVLLWWHGGGFTSGSGGWDWYDGGRLAALGDVVVVTANYRVGALGYLYLPEVGAANLGFQDQAAALRWVRDNIAFFGGDPLRVTVGGQSAGAYSSLMLALDPTTNAMVHRVLLQSGPFGLAPQDQHQAAETADAYLRLLDIPAGADRAAALRAVPAAQLLDAYGRLSAQLASPGNAAPPMYPVLGAPGMLHPLRKALAGGALEGKPLLIGTTREEATAFCAFDPRIQHLTTATALDILTKLGGQAARDAYQQHAAARPQATAAEIFTAVQTDILFRDDLLHIADHHAAGGNTTYVYQFDYAPSQDPHRLGATHCAELPFLFGTFDAFPHSPVLAGNDPDRPALGRAFATALTGFVTSGTAQDWLSYAPATSARIRHFG
ncbi:carboxylesterase family protein [Streptomyces sp. NBC_01462]|uniref:carboxylesterase family protein n=1 Tax=Streptomyces sp. NBC_01462 TaxID=2903876 RepID=UPI002E30E368|nr:carboxylesterase family protein [Streptomyces sp. NBC_01462]